MKKPTLIIGKRQMLLAGMTLVLGIAVYVNYAYSSAGGDVKKTKVVKSNSVSYGEAELVSADSASEDYFSQVRIERMNSRDEAVETLKSIIGGGDATTEEKAVAEESAQAMASLMESETKVESLVKAAGFQDCVVYLDGSNADIVVKTDSKGLQTSEAAQIKDILLSQVTVPNENIRIYDIDS